jgi:hypothetical protein
MDSLITAAARALAAGDPLGALQRIALRDDPPARALRGIAMAQLGDLGRAKELWHGTWEGEESDLRRIDPRTGQVLERIEMPSGVAVSGLESDGGDRFFWGGGNSG